MLLSGSYKIDQGVYVSEFLSIKEVASIFGVSELTIRRAIRKNLISAIRVGDGKKSPYRISKKIIDDIHEGQIFMHKYKINLPFDRDISQP